MSDVFKITKSAGTFKTTKANTTPKTVNAKIRGLDLDTSRIKYNQLPVETPDGANKVFTLPNSHEYVTGLLEIYRDGIQQTKDVDWTETTPSTFTFTTAPDSDEAVRISYVKQ